MFKVAIHMANLFKLTEEFLLAMQNHPGQCHTKLATPETLLFKKQHVALKPLLHVAIYILGNLWSLHSSELTS
jgi:hypothetical protein